MLSSYGIDLLQEALPRVWSIQDRLGNSESVLSAMPIMETICTISDLRQSSFKGVTLERSHSSKKAEVLSPDTSNLALPLAYYIRHHVFYVLKLC